MSLQHFFLENQVIDEELEKSLDGVFSLNLCPEDIKHARALRLDVGEHIGVIDSDNIFFECEICDFSSKDIRVKVTKHGGVATSPSNIELTLCFGLLKGSKTDEVIRGCTEIGIDRFIPVEFSRCVSRPDNKSENKKIERWQKIAKSASMQSGQYRFPEISNFTNLDLLACDLSTFDLVIIFWEESDADLRESLNQIAIDEDSQYRIAIIVGPEGGISEEEIHQITDKAKNSCVVTMGRSILRAQTACVMASGIVNYLLRE